MTNFEKWNNAFQSNNLSAFNHNEKALLYLKVRAIRRGKLIKKFTEKYQLELKSTKVNNQFSELYSLLENNPNGKNMLNTFLQDRNNEWYKTKKINEEEVKSDLRKIDTYEWGGDQNNSLDQYLVKRYVKDISNYNTLQKKADEIATNAWKFVQTSWYNKWTSYLIESIFKKHERVLSAIGEIKSVDFFIDDYPIDLKVTYFPNEYMENRLKEKIGNKELTWLKKKAKALGIKSGKKLSNSEQITFLKEELENNGHSEVIKQLTDTKKYIIEEVRKHPKTLIKWLYEHQSVRLFGAENRLFLVLVDIKDMKQSWKMKRAFSLLEPKIKEFLDKFSAKSLKEITFNFKGTNYTSLSDIIFIVKE